MLRSSPGDFQAGPDLGQAVGVTSCAAPVRSVRAGHVCGLMEGLELAAGWDVSQQQSGAGAAWPWLTPLGTAPGTVCGAAAARRGQQVPSRDLLGAWTRHGGCRSSWWLRRRGEPWHGWCPGRCPLPLPWPGGQQRGPGGPGTPGDEARRGRAVGPSRPLRSPSPTGSPPLCPAPAGQPGTTLGAPVSGWSGRRDPRVLPAVPLHPRPSRGCCPAPGPAGGWQWVAVGDGCSGQGPPPARK